MKTIARNVNPLQRQKPSRAERRAFQKAREEAKGICRTDSKCFCGGTFKQLVFRWSEALALCCGAKVDTSLYNYDGTTDWGQIKWHERGYCGGCKPWCGQS